MIIVLAWAIIGEVRKGSIGGEENGCRWRCDGLGGEAPKG